MPDNVDYSIPFVTIHIDRNMFPGRVRWVVSFGSSVIWHNDSEAEVRRVAKIMSAAIAHGLSEAFPHE